jgi:hypothetical protein
MATTLAAARGALYTACASVTTAQRYKTRQTNYQYPAIVIGWPQSMDMRPAMGDQRDFVIDVGIAVEVTDDEGSDDTLSGLLESVVTAFSATGTWDVQPATDFGEELIADGRVVIWCRVPVAIYS